MRQMITTFAVLLSLVASNAYAMEVWWLVHSEYTSSGWFCTYELQASSYQMTIRNGNSPCQQTITKY